MEHLTKQQIVLLTLLVSFVTSLSTGIVTVSLMDQSPTATHTISQVIEKTIQQAAPQNAAVGIISISVDDQLASSTSAVASGIVKIKNTLTNSIVGLGLVSSNGGTIITDPSIIQFGQSYSVVSNNGIILPVSFVASTSSVQYLQLSTNLSTQLDYSNSYKLGQKVFSLTGTTTQTLDNGFITGISSTSLDTTINTKNLTLGSPLFDINGEVIGVLLSNGFYPLAPPEASSTVL
jgi:hypothetical protein